MKVQARNLQQGDAVLLGEEGVGLIARVTTGNTHATVHWEQGEDGYMQPSFFELDQELEITRNDDDEDPPVDDSVPDGEAAE